MSLESVPKDMRGLRACKMCSMVKVSLCIEIQLAARNMSYFCLDVAVCLYDICVESSRIMQVQS